LEQRYRLTQPVQQSADATDRSPAGRTWSYRLQDVSSGNIRRLVQDAAVEDTSNIDRASFRVESDGQRNSPLRHVAFLLLAGGLFGLVVAGCTTAFGRACAADLGATFRRHTAGLPVNAVLLTTVFALTAVFRFLALRNGFPNDHFVYITPGWQMQFGEWPARDFVDPGLPLMFWSSAAAQALFGQTLLAEGLLVAAAFGLAAALTFAAATDLTGSRVLGLFAALFEVAVFPRTYGYPKLLAYALAFWVFGRYPRWPGTARLWAVAASVAIAFLFRHDHGLFLYLGGLLLVVLNAAPRGLGAATKQAAVFTALLLAMLLPYLVFVQAHTGLWLYLQTGIDFSQREAGRQGHVWPSLTGENPLQAALVYEYYLLPLAAAAVVAMYRRSDEFWRVAARILPIALVALLVDVSFIRDPLNTRLPDAIVPAVMLGSWLVWQAWKAGRWASLTAPVSVVALVLVGWSVAAAGGVAEELDRAGFPVAWRKVPDLLSQRASQLQQRFGDGNIPSSTVASLMPFFAYLDRCTTAADRLLYAGFPPDVPFFARRLFAGGLSQFGAFANLEELQRRVVERLRTQRVPIAIVRSEDDLPGEFPIIAAHVAERYVTLATVAVDEQVQLFILVDPAVPVRSRDAQTGYPCFS
jgi:4-amino-4-deoxy-L-arabinose transferase-like glycosyltransferase